MDTSLMDLGTSIEGASSPGEPGSSDRGAAGSSSTGAATSFLSFDTGNYLSSTEDDLYA